MKLIVLTTHLALIFTCIGLAHGRPQGQVMPNDDNPLAESQRPSQVQNQFEYKTENNDFLTESPTQDDQGRDQFQYTTDDNDFLTNDDGFLMEYQSPTQDQNQFQKIKTDDFLTEVPTEDRDQFQYTSGDDDFRAKLGNQAEFQDQDQDQFEAQPQADDDDDEDDHLCAPQVYSARFDDLYAPSLRLLQAQCFNLCASARNAGANAFGACNWKNVVDTIVQSNHLIRYARCEERCTGQTAFEGDCGCTVDADNIYVVADGDIIEECEAQKLAKKVFSERGWTQIFGTESPARPCP